MNPNLAVVEGAERGDGFVNFYELLGIPTDTPGAQIQEDVNALYQEAQTHRDHRVPARRREYQLLLEVLPHARTILLDPARRKRYNAYCEAVALQSQRIPYAEFLATLLREKAAPDSRSDILTLTDLSRLRNGTSTATETQPATPLSQLTAHKPAPSAAAPEVAKFSPAPAVAAPTAPTSKFRLSLSAFCGGAIVLMGLAAFLPVLAGLPLQVWAPLAVISALVTAYVFSLTSEGIAA